MSHGMSRTKLYQAWSDMKQRCSNPKNQFYHRYGGRGIKYCDEWKTFEPFYNWAISNGYAEGLTIDRIDNDGDYCPENCKWSTQHEQSMNKEHLKSKTGYVGVRYKAGKYQAEVTRFGKYYYIGRYDTPEEANAARVKFVEAGGWF